MKKYLSNKKIYVILVCLFFFLLIAILVLKKGVLDIDQNSYIFIKEHIINDNLTPYIKVFTNLGGVVILVTITILIALFIENNKISLAIIINLILATIINLLAKSVFQRDRPVISNWLVDEFGYSFPSGHSSVSMAFYGFLIYLVCKNFKNKKTKYIVVSLLSLVILFVGISRIYLGVHYLSDVLAGYLLSIIYLMIFICFYNHFME